MNDPEKEDEGKTFDMYHFFSRWDVLLVIAVILILLVYALASNFFGPSGQGAI